MEFTDEIHINAVAGCAEAKLFVHPEADYLKDHFPGAPMLPGLLMLESAVRTAAALWQARCDDDASFAAELDLVERLHILRQVVPGETLVVQVEMQAPSVSETFGAARFKARANVNGKATMRTAFYLRSPAAVRSERSRGQSCKQS